MLTITQTRECKSCENHFDTERQGLDHGFFAWWDTAMTTPLCSLECLAEYEKENGWEFEEDFDSLEIEQLKSEMKLFNEG